MVRSPSEKIIIARVERELLTSWTINERTAFLRVARELGLTPERVEEVWRKRDLEV